ncbi:MAG: hypothetical protein ABI880_10565, partial [Acidobacteriota bacterium]
MGTTDNFFSGFAAARARLAMLVAAVVATIGFAGPAAADLQNPLTVSAQSGTLTAGTVGSATYTVTVRRNFNSPASPTMSISGLPNGATGSFGIPSAWSGNLFTVGTRTYPLTITTTAAAVATTGTT